MLCDRTAKFDLAVRLRAEGVALGELFSFLSGLYFRGKLAYARHFSHPPVGLAGVWVITPNRGLLPADLTISLDQLRAFGRLDIDEENPRYRRPVARDARRIADQIDHDGEVVLLGSIATGKYIGVLHGQLGSRLRYPAEFVGRGDMSRGGLMLQCVRERRELNYLTVAETTPRRGTRPPKLLPRCQFA